MAIKTKEESKQPHRRSTGRVVEPEYHKDGTPNLKPTAGYAGHEPVQYDDESDEVFAQRVAMFESARNTAEQIEAGGATLEQKKEAARIRYEAEILNIESEDKTLPKRHPAT